MPLRQGRAYEDIEMREKKAHGKFLGGYGLVIVKMMGK